MVSRKRITRTAQLKSGGRSTASPHNSTSPASDKNIPESGIPTLGNASEFRQSAIPDRLTQENITFCDPGAGLQVILSEVAIANAQKSTSFVGRQAARILDRYANAQFGGWVAWGTTIDGDIGPVPMVKLSKPRESAAFRGFGATPEMKPVKYETPADCPALPILPWVDSETAQQIYDRHKITPQEGEAFWRAVQRSGCAIAVTEGLKKALCLIAHGIPAIALRGVACWHSKGDKTQLYNALADFATDGRKVQIVFDEDFKAATVKNVGIQINQLGKALQKRGCKVFVWDWLPSEGKGIDDAIFNAGEHGQNWLDKVASSASDLKTYQKKSAVPRLLAAIERAKTLGMSPDRDTEGDYLPECSTVETGSITVIEAPTGAGKTTEIRRQIATHRANGGNTIVLYSLNALGQQTATAADLPHLHDYNLGSREFEADIAYRQGLVMCFDSLHRIPGWFLEKPLLLILDECNQGIDHLVNGETLGDRQSEILNLFAQAATRAAQSGAIVLAEARVYPHTVEFVQTVSGCQSVKYLRHNRITDRGTVEISSTGGLSALYPKALAAVDQGEKIIWAATSQVNTRLMDLLFSQAGKRVVRIDSQTNRNGEFRGFFDNPNDWLEANSADLDVLILSPSCKTGVSITFPAFDRVFGYFPSLGPDDALQMLTRYRLAVPRQVYIPQWIQTQGDESLFGAAQIKKRLNLNLDFNVQAHGLLMDSSDAETAIVTTATIEYYAKSTALRGSQKAIAAACLAASLTAEGFEVTEIQAKGDRAVSSEIFEVRDSLIWQADAATMSRAIPYETPDGAKRVLGNPCSLEDEFRAQKTLWIERFPGIDFDDSDSCYHTIYRQRGLMARGVETQAAVENLGAVASLDTVNAKSSLESGLSHKLPRKYVRSLLLQAIGVLDLVAIEDGIFTNADAICQQVQAAAIKYRGEVRYWLNLTITEEYRDTNGRRCHTPIDVCGKLLGKFGLEFAATARPGGGRDRQREYQVVPIVPTGDDKSADQVESRKYRQQLLAAARQRLETLPVADKAIATVINAEPAATQSKTDWTPTIGAAVWAWDFDSWVQATITAIDSAGRWLVDLATGWDLAISNPNHLAPYVGGAA